jgi:signal transduction histidine kinase
VHVPDFLAALEAETHGVRAQTDLDFVWRLETRVPVVYTDPAKLKVVLKNLVGNAVKFTPHGQITVAVCRRDEGVEFRVTDTGIGISHDALSRIFEAFQQVEKPQHQSANGVGLGLYIVKRLLELLKGSITVESVVGQGSTFRVWLPITLESAPSLRQK